MDNGSGFRKELLYQIEHPFSEEQLRANYLAEIGHCEHLVYVRVDREWCYINGERELSFKTRGNNDFDLREALVKYDIEWWECDLARCTRDMSDQLYAQTRKRREEPVKLVAIA